MLDSFLLNKTQPHDKKISFLPLQFVVCYIAVIFFKTANETIVIFLNWINDTSSLGEL